MYHLELEHSESNTILWTDTNLKTKAMKKVLLIEDDKDLCETISLFLGNNEFIVYTASDGIQGVQEAVKIIPDIIICDIAMPNLDGYGVYETLRNINITTAIPFIFLTAKTEVRDIRAGMNLGADDYITKPFEHIDLLQAIQIRIEKQKKLNAITEKKFLSILDNPINGVFIFQNKQLIYANNKLAEMLNEDPEQIKNDSLDNFIVNYIHKDNRPELIKYFQKASLNEAESTLLLVNILHKNKTHKLYNLFLKTTTINDKASVIGYVVEAVSKSEKDDDNKLAEVDTDLISSREKEVLLLICHGMVNKEIADKLNISKRTVDRHRDNLMKKTHSRNTAELLINSIKLGLVEL
ncbi:MAG: hypothetical protein A2275_15265 [Bacteroidetes bacterium RIFOXYA12_FULL_35_11]|nr:MAG: hypothetical protein A2X01_08085 [Bacteroidetes bacterium GWF2_35_48]OFY83296.1 MAG: hypothetical protein A2275_15265 [Bacteroidetes bacterium RIFOXYA12_FULL_35_11]OFY93099.1 MAG: hypothetical protein A2491_03510 [Bacteroidetes bacterium RIFOXYC12_FULL_35_7]OFY96613.1 MAG: hypothetical protein A2309_04610 [Bacteroidetes bacterium RIFOXYB2_FULL_35_7]HBX52652.1 hypothetical protein [Bacteroidales bacterium]